MTIAASLSDANSLIVVVVWNEGLRLRIMAGLEVGIVVLDTKVASLLSVSGLKARGLRRVHCTRRASAGQVAVKFELCDLRLVLSARKVVTLGERINSKMIKLGSKPRSDRVASALRKLSAMKGFVFFLMKLYVDLCAYLCALRWIHCSWRVYSLWVVTRFAVTKW